MNPSCLSCGQIRRGFTLLELLASIAFIAILAALLFPALGTMKQRGLESSCASRIRQLSVALHSSVVENNGTFPKFVRDSSMTPYISEPDAYLEPYLGTKDAKAWHCPSDTGKGAQAPPDVPITRSYSFNSYLTGDFSGTPITNLHSIPKPSRTVLVCENWVGWWPSTSNGVVSLYPYDQTGNDAPSYEPKLHRDKSLSNYAFVDGHVELLSWKQVSPNKTGGRGMFAIDDALRDGL